MFKALIPTFLSFIPLAVAPFSDVLTAQIQSNPYVYMGLQTLLTVLANLMQSPLKPK